MAYNLNRYTDNQTTPWSQRIVPHISWFIPNSFQFGNWDPMWQLSLEFKRMLSGFVAIVKWYYDGSFWIVGVFIQQIDEIYSHFIHGRAMSFSASYDTFGFIENHRLYYILSNILGFLIFLQILLARFNPMIIFVGSTSSGFLMISWNDNSSLKIISVR